MGVSLLKLLKDRVRIILSSRLAEFFMFCMWGVKVKCVSKVRPRILGVLFSGIVLLFRVICGWIFDWCLSVVISVIEDFSADADIRLVLSQFSSCVM